MEEYASIERIADVEQSSGYNMLGYTVRVTFPKLDICMESFCSKFMVPIEIMSEEFQTEEGVSGKRSYHFLEGVLRAEFELYFMAGNGLYAKLFKEVEDLNSSPPEVLQQHALEVLEEYLKKRPEKQ